ncbi:alpha/beta hydrolase [Pontibacillus sp. HMF3514]|uniref:alpha/beta hydrolase n=1 Tax=Pontibacillus sp. HMF3514 TaxID=2692425 RepID=UPI00131FC713|nr:alpha/beta hydrolase [Pontibacillus sp. HMF3514]QHE51888.1 alpha/beta fold hydrolase [Pontibacillus sp. HMF3514]
MAHNMDEILRKASNWDQPIDFRNPIAPSHAIKQYLTYYGLDIPHTKFHMGVLYANDTKIMVQMHSPEQPIGTILLLHGYFDHAGLLRTIIEYLTKYQYRVIVYDLQGHGLSGGEKASVQKFNHYGQTLQKVIDLMTDQLPPPYHAIGHSTGGAIIINYILKKKKHPFTTIITAAPLIRSKHWKLTKAGYYLLNPFVNGIFRKFRANSSNKDYLKFVKQDPLQHKRVPFQWYEALIRWNKSIQEQGRSYDPISVIQGDLDDTVDWKFNLKFLREKFPKADIHHMPKARHHLFNEREEIKGKVFSLIFKKLNGEEMLNDTNQSKGQNGEG